MRRFRSHACCRRYFQYYHNHDGFKGCCDGIAASPSALESSLPILLKADAGALERGGSRSAAANSASI
jgi:hypothetical protein